MKPIVIVQKKPNDKIEMTLEEFKKYLDDAYEEGFAAGRRKDSVVIREYASPYWPWGWGQTIYDHTPIITCGSDAGINTTADVSYVTLESTSATEG